MRDQDVMRIAYDKGIKHSGLFTCFIKERFPNESHGPYVAEWADRFLSGNPVIYMDDETKEAFIECVRKVK